VVGAFVAPPPMILELCCWLCMGQHSNQTSGPYPFYLQAARGDNNRRQCDCDCTHCRTSECPGGGVDSIRFS
jgi:hypothetical protein